MIELLDTVRCCGRAEDGHIDIGIVEYRRIDIDGLMLCESRVFADDRGYFMETFRQADFDKAMGRHVDFVQENESHSMRGALRGIHLQLGSSAQAKLVRCVFGRVIDIAVDLRPSSSTFGQHRAFDLSAANKLQLYIPHGFGHAFLALSSEATFAYKVDQLYDPSAECCIRYDDTRLSIPWTSYGIALDELIVSSKDAQGITLDQAVERGLL